MMKASVSAALAVVVLAAGPAFAGDQHYRVVATDPTNNSRIEVPLGDRLVLRLDACESCGFSWRIMQKPNAAVIEFSRQLKSQPEPTCQGCVGGSVHERFQFQSKGHGQTSVELGYFGPAKTKPSKTKLLNLAVTG
jgi:predicted secreted protein